LGLTARRADLTLRARGSDCHDPTSPSPLGKNDLQLLARYDPRCNPFLWALDQASTMATASSRVALSVHPQLSAADVDVCA